MAGESKQVSPPKVKDLHLPISRVKTIMKSSPDVDVVGLEPLFLVTKVTELFIADLAQLAYQKAKNAKQLEYKHIANVVKDDETLDFLREIMPCKITMRQYRELMRRREERGDRSDDGSSSEEGSSEEEEEAEEEESEEEAEKNK